ncbi:hypothetical protein IEQ34_000434 [Dendrobium chrysotoxum]|uniref:Uncharacterized protein n=1 Tax=Dendrobium chrysotoxum TaxID=161865 RepID=A0AAV7HP74_DENCH|nr:hypothetical protein IEQ34_000434 [Dendrobium chrysotoxum]
MELDLQYDSNSVAALMVMDSLVVWKKAGWMSGYSILWGGALAMWGPRSGFKRTKIARMEFDLIRLLEQSASAPTAIDSLEVVEGCGVDVMLELSLGLSSGKVECRKWARESNETVGVKKPKMEEGPMPYCLQVMPTIFIGLKGYYYAYMMPCWVLISMKVVGNNLYEPRDYPNLALEMDGVATGDWKVVVARESSSSKSLYSRTYVLQFLY